MSKKRRNRHHKGEQESKFEFEEAKDLTVGQAIRKNEEVEAGVNISSNTVKKSKQTNLKIYKRKKRSLLKAWMI